MSYKVRKEVEFITYLIGLGMGLVAFAYGSFSTKGEVKSLEEQVKEIREDQKSIIKQLSKIEGILERR